MYSGQGGSGKLTDWAVFDSQTGAKDHDHVCIAPLKLLLHTLSLQVRHSKKHLFVLNTGLADFVPWLVSHCP